jgi:hypothetical protein
MRIEDDLLATAPMARTVEDARERGADAVLIGARPEETPRHMVASMGFRSLCVTRAYLKTLAAGGRTSVRSVESRGSRRAPGGGQ